MHFAQNQVFGSPQPYETIEPQDIINAIKFDPTGHILAIGDNAGRIILFKQQLDDFTNKKSFEYYAEFQSHVEEFDTLKSMTMAEAITQIKWLRPQGNYQKMVTANSNTIKLWKMFEKTISKPISHSQNNILDNQHPDLAFPLLNRQTSFTSKCQITFPSRHQSAINQAEITANEEYMLSTDKQRAIMWNFDKVSSPFVVQQTKQKKYWKEGQKIACSKLHPFSDSMFLTGSTKGRIELNDLRVSVNNRKNSQFLFEKQTDKTNDYFHEMTTKINSLQFMVSGRYIVARDYLTVKLWDVCRTAEPVSVVEIHPQMREKMCHLFQNDCIEDEFQMATLGSGMVITGSYDNRFHIINPFETSNIEYAMGFDEKDAKKNIIQPGKKTFSAEFKHNSKVMACGVHSQSEKIALASLNSFFIYSPQKQQSGEDCQF